MSALSRNDLVFQGAGYTGMRMSAHDFLALGETRERYELIDGVVVMSPSPVPLHSELVLEVLRQLFLFSVGRERLRVFSETDILLTSGDVYRPDLCIYLPGRVPPNTPLLDLPPDLVLEVASPSTKRLDYITKRDDYEAFGVGEYWIVDAIQPDGGDQEGRPSRPAPARRTLSVRCWRRQNDRLVATTVEGDSLASVSLPGFVLDFAPLRALIEQ
ncbi:MAG: Uma2 family endonuclease [Planctomycetota bacterium]|nr:Uma2 family endonuclease [Planctomycetota bacterium]